MVYSSGIDQSAVRFKRRIEPSPTHGIRLDARANRGELDPKGQYGNIRFPVIILAIMNAKEYVNKCGPQFTDCNVCFAA